MKHILALTDFSTASEDAVDAAFRFAQQYDCDLTIFHQLTEGEVIAVDLSEVQDSTTLFSALTPALYSFRNWKERSLQDGIETRCKFSGDPLSTAIANLSEDTPIDVIFMGASGKNQRRDDYFWGSHTQAIVSAVDVPVMVVNRPIDNLPFKNIVFASSFNQEEKEVFFFFLDLLNPPPETVIHLLSIDTMNYFSQPSIIIQAAMRDFADLAKDRKVKLHFYEDSSIARGIQHFIEEEQADLLVMSHKFDRPLRHILRGDNTLKIIDNARIPVLTLDYQD